MENIEEIIDKFGKIEYLEKHKTYGYYPFKLIAIMGNHYEVCILPSTNGVIPPYVIFGTFIKKNAKKIMMAMDFPPTRDIKHNFVCVFSYENGEINSIALPYDDITGKEFDEIVEADVLTELVDQIKHVINSEQYSIPVGLN